MFVVHGGAYNMGTANDELLGPDFIVNADVILVCQSTLLSLCLSLLYEYFYCRRSRLTFGLVSSAFYRWVCRSTRATWR